MRKIINILTLFIALVLLVGCSETLEDTYSNVTNGGKIRYVAKCSDISVTPGWERLIVKWKNGTDATIDKIKLTWTYNGIKDSVLLDRLTTEFTLEKLTNAVYRFDIIAMDKEGNKSLGETTYGRPYTKDHEIMNAFTRGVTKAYFLKNKMIFFADKWNKNILDIRLKYKDTDGKDQEYVFKEDTYDKLITIDNVSMNPEDVVYVLRQGTFDDSPDVVTFDPYPVNRNKIYSSGFLIAIERRYGYSTETKEEEVLFEKFINEVTELEFDYDIESFEDILYCQNLKKMIFGKNRYTTMNFDAMAHRSIISGNEARSKAVVEKAMELFGVSVEYYENKTIPHYFKPAIAGSIWMNRPVLPNMEIIGKEAFKEYENGNLISCTPLDPYAELNNLFDNDSNTYWETTSTTQVKNYEMYMELKEATEVCGIKIAQRNYVPRNDKRTPFFSPKIITIETSLDGANWKNVTNFKTNVIGKSAGEVTLLQFPEGKRLIRHIRISLQDGTDVNNNSLIILGDLVLYK